MQFHVKISSALTGVAVRQAVQGVRSFDGMIVLTVSSDWFAVGLLLVMEQSARFLVLIATGYSQETALSCRPSPHHASKSLLAKKRRGG